MKPRLNVASLVTMVRDSADFQIAGRLVSTRGLLVSTLPAAIGEMCQIVPEDGPPVSAEVVGFHGGQSLLMPLESSSSFSNGCAVVGLNRSMRVPVGAGLAGRVIDALARPIDGRGPLAATHWISANPATPNPMQREVISEQVCTGQRAIESLLPVGRGQRIGIFACSGVGKSTLLGEIAKHVNADINVVALVGERGREVRPFIHECLGPSGLARSIVIVSTADQPPLARIRAARTAIAIADWYRGQGKHVVLMIDSLTRLAWAQREIGLLKGEPPSSRGFPPSAMQLMAGMVEQLGTSDRGAITGFLTVLVDGDDTTEPVADAARAVLDGHIVLDRRLAERGHFPAINVLTSISRLARELLDARQFATVRAARQVLSECTEVEDLVRIGAYQPGTSAVIDQALRLKPALDRFLCQAPGESETIARSRSMLSAIVSGQLADATGNERVGTKA